MDVKQPTAKLGKRESCVPLFSLPLPRSTRLQVLTKVDGSPEIDRPQPSTKLYSPWRVPKRTKDNQNGNTKVPLPSSCHYFVENNAEDPILVDIVLLPPQTKPKPQKASKKQKGESRRFRRWVRGVDFRTDTFFLNLRAPIITKEGL